MKRFIPLIFAIGLVFLPILFVPSCANTTQSPSGGKKDTIPPYIIDIKPLPGAVNVPLKGASFTFTFNEFVSIKTPSNIFLSPPTQKQPKSKLRGKSLVVSIPDSLRPNTTYTLTFTDAIADANEGNMFAGYTYAFSTGPKIDSMMTTGTVRDCNTLIPVKGATVLLYKDLSDSAVFKTRPYAAAKTDDWGYFALPFIQDTSYRLYAIKDANNNNLYDPESETIAFIDSLIRPRMEANDTVKEMLRYDMKDTLSCLARTSENELLLFKERPSKQYIVNKERTAERSAYITFMAPDVEIDSLWIKGYRADQVISSFNILRDSLELWINSRRAAPDTMKISVRYRKTDSLGRLQPSEEMVRLALANEKKTYSKTSRRSIKHEDTTCVYTLTAKPETMEQNGYSLEFKYPIIYENFDSLKFWYITSRQKQVSGKVDVEKDSLNLRRYVIRPKDKLMPGYEYYLKLPPRAFRDINGFYSDSTEVKFSLPTDEALSEMELNLTGVDRKLIVDLLNEKRNQVLRSYVIDAPGILVFPYIKAGKYSIRITEDGNRNSIVDTGVLLEHKQPEKVLYFKLNDKDYIDIPAGTTLEQAIDAMALFGK